MRCAPSFDMIKRQKLVMRFTATGTVTATVRIERLTFEL
jgi:hypothetical protein